MLIYDHDNKDDGGINGRANNKDNQGPEQILFLTGKFMYFITRGGAAKNQIGIAMDVGKEWHSWMVGEGG